MIKYNEYAKFEEGELKDIPKDIAYKLFIGNKHKVIIDIIKALNLDEGTNALILTKIHNEMERRLGKRGTDVGVFVMPDEYIKGLTDEQKQQIINYIEEVFKIEEEYHKKLNKLTNDFLDKN